MHRGFNEVLKMLLQPQYIAHDYSIHATSDKGRANSVYDVHFDGGHLHELVTATADATPTLHHAYATPTDHLERPPTTFNVASPTRVAGSRDGSSPLEKNPLMFEQ